jgi:hypothetical protein
MALVALDLVAWKQAHGKYPAALAELPNADKLPRDPFNEKPFGYRLTDEGFMLWSVGPDGKDDGGKTFEELELNSMDNGGDLVLRVPPAKKP